MVKMSIIVITEKWKNKKQIGNRNGKVENPILLKLIPTTKQCRIQVRKIFIVMSLGHLL